MVDIYQNHDTATHLGPQDEEIQGVSASLSESMPQQLDRVAASAMDARDSEADQTHPYGTQISDAPTSSVDALLSFPTKRPATSSPVSVAPTVTGDPHPHLGPTRSDRRRL